MNLEDMAIEFSNFTLPDPESGPLGYFQIYIVPELTLVTLTKKKTRCVRWCIEYLGPTHTGLQEYKWSMIEGPGLFFTKGELSLLGFNIRSKKDLHVAINEIRGMMINIQVVRNDKNKRQILFIGRCLKEEVNEIKNKFWIPDTYRSKYK